MSFAERSWIPAFSLFAAYCGDTPESKATQSRPLSVVLNQSYHWSIPTPKRYGSSPRFARSPVIEPKGRGGNAASPAFMRNGGEDTSQ